MNNLTPKQLQAAIEAVDRYARPQRQKSVTNQLAGIIQDAEKIDPNFGRRLLSAAETVKRNRDLMDVALYRPMRSGAEDKPIKTVEDFVLHSCGLARKGE